jgi:hypothetical protein
MSRGLFFAEGSDKIAFLEFPEMAANAFNAPQAYFGSNAPNVTLLVIVVA